MKPKPLTKAQAIRKILADNKSELKHLMGKETLTSFSNVDDSTAYLLHKAKFKVEKITFDKYNNKNLHMIRIK